MPLQEVGANPERKADMCGAQPRPPPPTARCVAHVSEYCRSSSLDGLRYVGDDQRPIAERLLWAFLFAISLALCSLLIFQTWLKWYRTPVIVTFAEKTTPVWEVPFPAVTICSQTKTQRHLFNFSDVYNRVGTLSTYEWLGLLDLILVCSNFNYHEMTHGDFFTDNDTSNFLMQVAPTLEETVYSYIWRGNLSFSASNVFRKTMTQDGLCYTFNILDEEDIYTEEVVDEMKSNNGNKGLPRRPSAWSAEHGFKEGSGLDTHPVRSLGPGRTNGLSLVVAVSKQNIDLICEGYLQGFKVLLHTPGELPQTRLRYLQVPFDQETTLAIQPNQLTTSEGLRGYPPHRRQCYFSSERRLRYFRNYTQGNCELECLSNITLHRCGCVSHHMARPAGTPICAPKSIPCVTRSTEELVRRKVVKDLKSGGEGGEAGPADCDCLPSCMALTFDVEISQAHLDAVAYFRANNIRDSLPERSRVSILSVYFKSREFIPSRRSELYGLTDFIANCGGLLGLFMGFSLLSLVEIFYFFSVRLGFSHMLRRSTEKRTANNSEPRCSECITLETPSIDGRSEMPLQEVGANPERQADTCGAQPRPPPPTARCVAHVSEYCRSSSLDGLRYVGDDQRPIAERLFWAFLFAISLALCSILIFQTWRKWDRTPVIVTFAETTKPIWEVPFPAVTICSETKTERNLFNFTKAHLRVNNLSSDERLAYLDLTLVCSDFKSHKHTNITEVFSDNKTLKFLHWVAPKMNQTILKYTWRDEVFETASTGFRQMMTRDGLCFTFNILDEEDIYTEEVLNVMKESDGNVDLQRRTSTWSPENGYREGSDLDTHPKRSLGPGLDNGLTIMLAVSKENIDHICPGFVQGFKVALHTPDEVPQTQLRYLHLPFDQEMTVAIRPNLLTTSEGLRGYPPHRRKCYFPFERRLRYFRNYTQTNCEIECLSNITLHRCGCVSHYMPRTEDTIICAIGSFSCVKSSIEELVRRNVARDSNPDRDHSDSSHADCNCLPSCTDLSYDMEISQADLNAEPYFHALSISDSLGEWNRLSILSVYFKSREFMPSRRSELYGVTDFIANCGGLLGLFMGFSLLSLVEILYFFSVRLGFTQLLRRSTKKRAVDS